jgi:very-short-patch-repair endonuclease
MKELWAQFLDSRYEISTIGRYRLDGKVVELPGPVYLIGNPPHYAISFNDNLVLLVLAIIKSFTKMDVSLRDIAFIDGNCNNISLSNLLVRSKSVLRMAEYCSKMANFPTLHEVKFKEMFPDLELEPQRAFTNEKSFYIVDYFHPMSRIAFELDGCHHYINQYINDYDLIRDQYLLDVFNVQVVRIPNTKLDHNPKTVTELVSNAIKCRIVELKEYFDKISKEEIFEYSVLMVVTRNFNRFRYLLSVGSAQRIFSKLGKLELKFRERNIQLVQLDNDVLKFLEYLIFVVSLNDGKEGVLPPWRLDTGKLTELITKVSKYVSEYIKIRVNEESYMFSFVGVTWGKNRKYKVIN